MATVPGPRFAEHGNVVDLNYERFMRHFKSLWDKGFVPLTPSPIWPPGTMHGRFEHPDWRLDPDYRGYRLYTKEELEKTVDFGSIKVPLEWLTDDDE